MVRRRLDLGQRDDGGLSGSWMARRRFSARFSVSSRRQAAQDLGPSVSAHSTRSRRSDTVAEQRSRPAGEGVLWGKGPRD
ncbi:hypothetical protein GUJ93_ZPchr0019g2687 [Zizania palustris]|uniref:Uncharacterized protein n=1 Tax=Zizania palustris TaxID=103762 RepID=A0A8J5W078_ZIZPA|nr:hypothetical protein GUJ93_ZPchr0019g2687 [Zizania palustris]